MSGAAKTKRAAPAATITFHGQGAPTESVPNPPGLITSFDQIKRTDLMISSTEQVKRIDHSVMPDHSITSNEQIEQVKRSDQMIAPGSTSNDHSERSGQLLATDTQNKLDTSLRARTGHQRAVFNYLAANPNIITTYNLIHRELGIPAVTIRRAITLLEKAGILTKRKYYGERNVQGIHIVFDHSKRSLRVSSPDDQIKRPNQSPLRKIDRKEFYLSERAEEPRKEFSQDELKLNYPVLVGIGFGTSQMSQITDNLAKVGKPDDKLCSGLEHANAWLEGGALVDSKGETVKDPLGYIFSSLFRTGYFAKPKGFVTPEEVAARDAQERADAVKRAAASREQSEFEIWLAGLSAAELEQAQEGMKGPREQWLKSQWRAATRPLGETGNQGAASPPACAN